MTTLTNIEHIETALECIENDIMVSNDIDTVKKQMSNIIYVLQDIVNALRDNELQQPFLNS